MDMSLKVAHTELIIIKVKVKKINTVHSCINLTIPRNIDVMRRTRAAVNNVTTRSYWLTNACRLADQYQLIILTKQQAGVIQLTDRYNDHITTNICRWIRQQGNEMIYVSITVYVMHATTQLGIMCRLRNGILWTLLISARPEAIISPLIWNSLSAIQWPRLAGHGVWCHIH